MIGFVLCMSAIIGLLIYLIYSWFARRQNMKVIETEVTKKILEKIRSKKKSTDKISLIEFLNLSPKITTKLINDMLEKDLIRIDDSKVSISEFGKHYYDKFLKRK